jgi:catechol 2,3-dioxygenase-like lactoylglutathione lyase family enzyme
VTIRATDPDASRRVYALLLAELGSTPHQDGWGDFSVAAADDEHPATRGLHIGFGAPSRAHVDAFWRAGLTAGWHDDGEPGPRPQYGDDYYGGFLRDPDGNSAEAVHHGNLRRGGTVDHLWIRVGDVEAARRFYEDVGRLAGFGLRRSLPGRVQMSAGNGSFSLVAGRPSEHVHLTFAAADPAAAGWRRDPDGNLVELVRHGRRGLL